MNDTVLNCVQELDKLAKDLGVTLSQLALAWILREPGISAALIGATKPTQIEENVKAVEVMLQPETCAEIERILKQVEGFEPLR
ncbi:aldo/keto reductase [Paenibacillus sp. 23TSA30-6]|uniref:aldo/keto reductase n=1 Tax=Paenibacillus sp. 23TSA30-6 TaxID=2546104 RepID=UPI001EE1A3A4|nr:aldo/keto reductase [Paenibacillus sp. 23TSA30-6]